jgi:3-oxoacyl-[acyl-carrier protein] reductase
VFPPEISQLPLLKGIDLSGKVAVVTGADGIAKATARVLGAAGCRLVIGELVAEVGDAVAAALRDFGCEAVAVQTDVSLHVHAQRLIRTALEEFGTVDILANVAGVYPAALVAEVSEETWRRVFAVNVEGVFNCCQAVLPTMMAKRGGKILNVASTDGVQPGIFPGMSGYGNAHYCASKGAVITFTKALAAEVAAYGINVNTISPSWVATEKAVAGGRFEEGLRHVPLGRGARPEEVAQAILFLVSDAAGFMTGENLIFSGGSVMD